MMEWREGDVTGILPYSRMVSPPGDTIAQAPTTILSIPRDRLQEMVRHCYQATTAMVHVMIDRARSFTSGDLHNEKMLSLGKLSAGLAHELNNPAAAIERNATLLRSRLEGAERAARVFGAARLSDEQLAAVDALRMSCLTRVAGVRSPIEQAEREDEIADWFASHGLDGAPAEAFAETDVTVADLERLAAAITGPALDAALEWAAAGCSVRTLTSEIQESATRIAGLVIAIKGFTHMDQAMVAEPVDLAQSLGNTVKVLRAKARTKSATVDIEVEDGLPRVRGFAGELNQIWANLIDNAARCHRGFGPVEVTRPASCSVCGAHRRQRSRYPGRDPRAHLRPVLHHQAVGDGTGLGLDIVRRLVRHNDGEITVESRPGRTEFRVVLPVAEDRR
jgi:signal transduction histidine kinase